MSLNTSNWSEYRLGNLFTIKKGKRLTAADQTDGETPYIGAIDSNNGITNYIGQNPIHEGNTISLSYNGSVGEAFYQPIPFWATDDVNVLYLNAEQGLLNEHRALFVCTILKQEKYRYCYGRKWTKEMMEDTMIKLPSKDKDHPDWEYMEQYIKSLKSEPITTKVTGSETPNFDVSEWKLFEIKELFRLENGKNKSSGDLEFGDDINYIGAKRNDNGVMKRVQLVPEVVSKGNCIVFICNGQGSVGYAIYMDKDFIGTSDIVAGYNENLTPLSGLFIATVFCLERPRYSWGRKLKTTLPTTKIKLPATSDGQPDWEFMENYIKSIPYGDRLM